MPNGYVSLNVNLLCVFCLFFLLIVQGITDKVTKCTEFFSAWYCCDITSHVTVFFIRIYTFIFSCQKSMYYH